MGESDGGSQGHFARVISFVNHLGIREYDVYYKGRMINDPDADGKQWIYRGMGISENSLPELLPFECYDWNRNEFLIGAAKTKKQAMKIIDKYLSDLKQLKS